MRLFTPTFDNPTVITTELADPLVWDRIFYSGEQTLYSILELSLDSEIIKIRQAHVHYNLRDYSAALATLQDLNESPAQGLRLLCYFALELYEQVLEAVIPRPMLPLELENAVYAHFAKSLAYSAGEKYEEALEHLAYAEDYAATLGLANRLGFIRLERERLNIWLGYPNPQRVEQLGLLVQNPRAKVWSQYLFTAANLYSGRYELAVRSYDGNSDPFEAALAQVLLGQSCTFEVADSEQLKLIRNVEAIWSGNYREVVKTEIDGLEGAYARTIYALAQFRTGSYHLALQHLGEAPAQPDAYVWWFLLRLGILTASHEPLLLEWQTLQEALENLQQYRHVLAFAAAHLPYEVWLASQYLPHPALVTARLELPILMNREFEHGNFKVAVAPQTAQALQDDARYGEDFRYQSLHRMERKRYQDLLKSRSLHFKGVVIQGGLIRRLERLQSFMPSEVWSQLLQDLHL
jgi:hypothetical protein